MRKVVLISLFVLLLATFGLAEEPNITYNIPPEGGLPCLVVDEATEIPIVYIGLTKEKPELEGILITQKACLDIAVPAFDKNQDTDRFKKVELTEVGLYHSVLFRRGAYEVLFEAYLKDGEYWWYKLTPATRHGMTSFGEYIRIGGEKERRKMTRFRVFPIFDYTED